MYIHGHFINGQNRKVSVHILTRGSRQPEIEIGGAQSGISFSDDPVEIESQVNDTFDHLLLTQATVRLLCSNYVADFFTSSCRDAVVNIDRDGECLFAGYIQPMALSQGYNEDCDEIELSCIDCLCALQYAKYRDIGALGVLYRAVKAEAQQRTFLEILKELPGGTGTTLDIVNGKEPQVFYDGSIATDRQAENRYLLFSQLAVHELLFLGDEEDDVWRQDEVLEELLKYLDLHIVQQGLRFYIFSWSSVKGGNGIAWQDLLSDATLYTPPATVDIQTDIAADTDTTLSIGEVYNKIMVTCSNKSMDSMVSSPLDDDLLGSPYTYYQKYMTEYSSDGEGETAINAFDALTHGKGTDYEEAYRRDWYVQVRSNSEWTFTDGGKGDLLAELCQNNRQQHALPDRMATQPAAAVLSWGNTETKAAAKDNAVQGRMERTNYLVVSVNGNGKDTEDEALPDAATLKAAVPCAVYNGAVSGGVLSPADDDTTNYIVISGSVLLQPLMKLTDTYGAIYRYKPTGTPLPGQKGIRQWWHKTVPSRNNGDGRYYTQQWWKADTPRTESVWNEMTARGLVPPLEDGPQELEFKYSAIGDGSDRVSKVAVLACMLVIGDKCVVETGTEGKPSDFHWQTYKPLEQCKDEDEYYQQSFTIGFDPKIGDKLIGTKFSMQNNISYLMGIDAEGTAIPITRGDKVNGRVRFMILGPVNTLWDEVTRRHRTWFRHTKWNSTSIPLLAHVGSIYIEQFEVKLYSDNALVNNTADDDLIYMSDTKESYVNPKDDIEMKIGSALTAAERQELNMTGSLRMNTPVNLLTGEGLLTVYDRNRDTAAKPEQLYVDRYYTEYHAPRVMMKQTLMDSSGTVSLWTRYRHPAMAGKTFFVQSISRNMEENTATLKLKETEL